MNQKNDGLSSNFITVWLGQLISAVGSGMTAFALGIYVFQKTGTATSYSLVILFAFLPFFLLQPLGGTLSDRVDRRVLMIIGDAGSAAGMFFIYVMMSYGVDELWTIYVGVAVSSLAYALQHPAYKSTITDLLDADSYSRASGLVQLAESSKFLISPVLAGLLLGFWDVKNILLIDVITFLLAIGAVFFIKKNISPKPSNNEDGFFKELSEGFRYTFNQNGLMWLLTLTSLLTFFVGFIQTLFGPMILSFTDSKTLGTALTLMASGMLISSLLIGLFSKSKKHILILTISLFSSGVFYALLGISMNMVFLIITGFLFFLSLPFVNTNLDVLIRKNVDNSIQGRVWSIVSLISQFGMLIAFGIAGILADYVFNPLFLKGGLLESSLGKITGTGPGRGIAFMFVLSGVFITVLSVIIGRARAIKALEKVSD